MRIILAKNEKSLLKSKGEEGQLATISKTNRVFKWLAGNWEPHKSSVKLDDEGEPNGSEENFSTEGLRRLDADHLIKGSTPDNRSGQMVIGEGGVVKVEATEDPTSHGYEAELVGFED